MIYVTELDLLYFLGTIYHQAPVVCLQFWFLGCELGCYNGWYRCMRILLVTAPHHNSEFIILVVLLAFLYFAVFISAIIDR